MKPVLFLVLTALLVLAACAVTNTVAPICPTEIGREWTTTCCAHVLAECAI
jgi:nitrous oxide reductase accessory protein NosL